MDAPSKGVISRSGTVPSVIVAKFDEPLPVDRPLRMKVHPAVERSKLPNGIIIGDKPETLNLQDVGGAVSFAAEKQKLDSNYIVIIKVPGMGPDGRDSYSAMPVSAWYNFNRTSNAPQLDAEEQAALFEQLQSLRRRPTAADALRQKLRADAEASGRDNSLRSAGSEDVPDYGEARAAMAAAAAAAAGDTGGWRKRGREGEGAGAGAGGEGGGGLASASGGGGWEDTAGYDDDLRGIDGGPGDFLDDAYANIDVPGTGIGGDEDAAGGGGGGGQEGAYGGGGDVADAGFGAGGGREFDVLGLEGGGEEVAIDYEPDWDDDAGDKGDQYAEVQLEGGVLPVLSASDLAQGEAALTYDGEEAAARDDEEEEEGGAGPGAAAAAAQRKAAEAAAAAASAAAAQSGGEELEAGRAVKRARVEASTPLGQLKEELKRLIVSMGGRITTKAISKHYKKRRDAEGEAFQQLLIAALKAVTRRVLLADQSVEYMLKE